MTIKRLLLRATGPTRLRADLQRMTRSIRTYRVRFEPLADVRATIPRAVIGGDLIDLLSDQLRAAIEYEAPPGSPAADERRQRSALVPPAIANDGQRGVPALRSGTRSERSMQPIEIDRARDQRMWRDDDPTQEQDDRFGSFGVAERGRTLPDFQRSALLSDPVPSIPPATIRSTDQRTASMQSALGRSLREYWRLHESDQATQDRKEAAPPPPAAQRQSAPTFGDRSDLMSDGRTWPEQTGQALMDRMAAFVGGRATTPTSNTPTNSNDGSDDHTKVQNVFHIAVNGSTDGSLHDLGERVADLLREQALQHGIDLL